MSMNPGQQKAAAARKPARPQQAAVDPLTQQLQAITQNLTTLSQGFATLVERQTQTDQRIDALLRQGTAPQVFTHQQAAPSMQQVQHAQSLAGAQRAPQNVRMDIARERSETLRRLRSQPKVPILIEEEHALWLGGLKIVFAPKGRYMDVPVEIAKAYGSWRREMSSIYQFNQMMQSAGGGTGMLNIAYLDALLGADEDTWLNV